MTPSLKLFTIDILVNVVNKGSELRLSSVSWSNHQFPSIITYMYKAIWLDDFCSTNQ